MATIEISSRKELFEMFKTCRHPSSGPENPTPKKCLIAKRRFILSHIKAISSIADAAVELPRLTRKKR